MEGMTSLMCVESGRPTFMMHHIQTSAYHSIQPPTTQTISPLKKFKINIHEAAPEINLQPPRLRLYHKDRRGRIFQKIGFILTHDDEQISHMQHSISKLLLEHREALRGGMVDAGFGKRHVLGHENPFPPAAEEIGEGSKGPPMVPDHEGVEVWGGPEAKRGEAGSRVFFREFVHLSHQPVFGWGVSYLFRERYFRLDESEINVEVSLAGRTGGDSHGFAGGVLFGQEGRTNDTSFVEASDDGSDGGVPVCWIVVDSVCLEVRVEFIPKAFGLFGVAGVGTGWRRVEGAFALVQEKGVFMWAAVL